MSVRACAKAISSDATSATSKYNGCEPSLQASSHPPPPPAAPAASRTQQMSGASFPTACPPPRLPRVPCSSASATVRTRTQSTGSSRLLCALFSCAKLTAPGSLDPVAPPTTPRPITAAGMAACSVGRIESTSRKARVHAMWAQGWQMKAVSLPVRNPARAGTCAHCVSCKCTAVCSHGTLTRPSLHIYVKAPNPPTPPLSCARARALSLSLARSLARSLSLSHAHTHTLVCVLCVCVCVLVCVSLEPGEGEAVAESRAFSQAMLSFVPHHWSPFTRTTRPCTPLPTPSCWRRAITHEGLATLGVGLAARNARHSVPPNSIAATHARQVCWAFIE